MPHIVIACTANICRSPYVEALLRRKLEPFDEHEWILSSAGTWAPVERSAARYSIRLAKEIGLDLSGHTSRMISAEIMREADLVLCMTSSHREALTIDFRDDKHKVFMLSEMIGRDFDVTDPYGGPLDGYIEMTTLVNQLLTEGLERIVQLSVRSTTTRL
ncbi:MAG: hypothetical protein ACPG8W_25440 [Candidatus Promineifilaceae bacterium]